MLQNWKQQIGCLEQEEVAELTRRLKVVQSARDLHYWEVVWPIFGHVERRMHSLRTDEASGEQKLSS